MTSPLHNESVVKARKDIMLMQQWIASHTEYVKSDPRVETLISAMYRTRSALESLMQVK